MTDSLKTLEEIRKANAPFPQNKSIMQWKEEGGKVIGWNCCGSLVPEEIIHAAGMLPVSVVGESKELTMEDANVYLGIYTCSFTRSCLQLALDGEYDFLDGLVSTYNCDGTRRLADVWRGNISIPVIHVLSTPRKFTERAKEFFALDIGDFKEKLEKQFQIKITDKSLSQAIETYNHTRNLLEKLYDLRKNDNPSLSGSEMMEIMNAAVRMPRDSFNSLLENLGEELEAGNRSLPANKRLMILGNILNNVEFIRETEALGATVVVDGLSTGTGYWSTLVNQNGDPIKSLSDRYLSKLHQSRFWPYEVRWKEVEKLIDDFRVEGVITETMRYCSHHIWDMPRLNKRLEEKDIPVLNLDLEYGMGMIGQVKTRVQAFLEMLQ